jgi:putative oxidoreductase
LDLLSMKFLRPFSGYAPLVLRLAVGLVMATHGWGKLTVMTPSGVAGFFGSLGVPAPGIMAWVVTLVELVGGIALILGLFTRLSGVLIAITLAVAILLVKTKVGLVASGGPMAGAELELGHLAGALSLALTGAGALSLDQMLGIDKTEG